MSDSSLLVYSWGWVGGFFAAPLGFLPCAVLFLRACSVRCFPCCRLPWGFQVTMGLSSCFPGDVGWASALPFFFWASPAPLACWGSWGFAPCVRVVQLRCCLLGLQVRSPCCPSLTLEWVCFWPTVSQVFVGCEGVSAALRGSSSFSCVCWSFTFSGVGVVWSQVCGPSCDSWFWTLLMLGCTVLTP